MKAVNNQDHEVSDCEDYFNKFAENGILENIFSRIVCRRSLALVNKLFYKTVCKIDSLMDIFRARFEQDQIIWQDGHPRENIYASVCCSSRVLTEICISQIYLVDIVADTYEENYKQCELLLGQTLRKISGSLKTFTVFSSLMTENQLMSILESLNKNKLKELNIIDGAIIHEKVRNVNRNISFPSLEKLDLSRTKYGNPNPDEPVCPNNEMFWFLKSIGENSPLMQDLSIHESFVNHINIENFKLKRLYVERAFPASLRLAKIISHHVNSLVMVDFLNCYVMEDVLNEILHVQQLKSLKINMDGISLKGFINISKSKKLTELGLKCSNACKWIVSALSMHTLDFLKKIYLDIKDLEVNYVDLSRMLNKNIPHFHVVASQHYILGSLFISTYIAEMKTCTIELYVDGFKNNKLLVNECIILAQLKEFSLINRNTQFYDFDFNLAEIFGRSLFLEKLRIEGFKVNAKLFETAIKGHYYLEELYLINPKGIRCDYVFDKNVNVPISVYGKRLKVLEISCAKSKLKWSKQFPVIIRRGSLKIFRYR
ncbi:uncharacterized protein [Chironomus tepperi]|uniref:uncharacterized protein n=1 Tax=Chironomus tepperi TaxID=113505 RepID=UPI00391F4D2C